MTSTFKRAGWRVPVAGDWFLSTSGYLRMCTKDMAVSGPRVIFTEVK